MMSMHFPYGNTSTAGQQLYGAAVRPNFEFNYNQYFASFYSNGDGLLPAPLMARNRSLNHREYQPLMPKSLLNNSCSNFSSSVPYKERHDIDRNHFLTFLEQKSKPMSELNPFANEFSLAKNANNQSIIVNNEKSSSYRLIFDDLIEHSLQSIDAIKKASKTVSVSHVSTQCEPLVDQINRSTQTNDQYSLLEECSSRAVKLTENLCENVMLLLSTKNSSYQLNSIRDICDELRYFISVTNQLITSNKSSINRDNLFSNMIKDLSIRSSPIECDIEERTCRVIPSTRSYSSSASAFSSRQILPIRSKLCLLCRRPVEDSTDDMHELCRLLSFPPGTSMHM